MKYVHRWNTDKGKFFLITEDIKPSGSVRLTEGYEGRVIKNPKRIVDILESVEVTRELPKEEPESKKETEPRKKKGAVSDIIRKYAIVLSAEKSLVLWADERYVGNIDRAKKKAVLKGKTSGGFDDQMILNASEGYGVLFIIDAKDKAGAMNVIDKVEPYPDNSIKNVYFYGDNAKENIRNALNMLRRV